MVKKSLKIVHMYPEVLNLYGDCGNVLTLEKRCEWRNIKTTTSNIDIGSKFVTGDIYFIGGGQDQDEFDVYKDLLRHKEKIDFLVKKGVVFLCLCAGLQLFGKEFTTGEGKVVKGLDIVDFRTFAAGVAVKDRSLGNIITKLNNKIMDTTSMELETLVGFENHIGQTYLGEGVEPLGYVITGRGNNIKDDFEGAVFRGVFCSYLHGPLLPKNPHFADFLLQKALEVKYQKNIKLSDLDDSEEIKAHRYTIEKIRGK